MTFRRWISVGSDLKFDARRDLDDVGATCAEGKTFLREVYLVFKFSLNICCLSPSKLMNFFEDWFLYFSMVKAKD